MVEKFRERQGWADSNVGKWIVFPQRGYTGGLSLNSPKSFFSDTWADELLAYQSESSFQKQSHTSQHCQKTRRPMCSCEAELCWWMTTLPSAQLVQCFQLTETALWSKVGLIRRTKGGNYKTKFSANQAKAARQYPQRFLESFCLWCSVGQCYGRRIRISRRLLGSSQGYGKEGSEAQRWAGMKWGLSKPR